MKKFTKNYYVLESKNREQFEEFIKGHNLTQVDICKKVGITYTMLYMILRGERTLSQETYDKFVKVGIDFEQMEINSTWKEN